jgi:uncharacterized membrane protein
MDNTHVHLLLNHFPIIGTLIGTILLFFGLFNKNNSIQNASLIVLFCMALISIPVFLTGESAEESVENLPGVVEAIIDKHEDFAEIAIWSMVITGLISITGAALNLLQSRMAKRIVILSFLSGVITFGLMARTAYLGGQIRHTEIRDNTSIFSGGQQIDEDDND